MSNSSFRSAAFAVWLACAAAIPPGASSQTGMRFDHLTMDDGLSESIVLSIVQDSRGYMWFGTADGLNRYDGYALRTFHNDPADTATIANNYVQRLYEDRSGNLWIGSLGGLDLYDPAHESFLRIPLAPKGVVVGVFGIAESPRDSSLWLATGADAYPPVAAARRFRSDSRDSSALHGSDLTAAAFDREGILWIGTRDNGLNLLDPAAGTFDHIVRRAGDEGSLNDDFIQQIFQDRQGTVWIGTENGGLNRYDRRAGTFSRYTANPAASGSIGHNTIRSVMEDRAGRLWVGTDGGGLDRYDAVADAFLHTRHDPLAASSLANNRLTAVYEDRAGALWAGTWGSGVDRWSPSKDKFRNDAKFRPLLDALGSPFVISLFEDSRGMLWAGTHGAGAVGYQPSTGELIFCRPEPGARDRLADGAVWSIREDRDGDLWFATNQGVDRFDIRKRTYTHYGESAGGLGSRFAGRAEPSGDYVWVTTDKGLDRIDRRTDSVRNFPYTIALGDRPQGYIAGFLRDGDLIFLGTTPMTAFDTRTLAYVQSPVRVEDIRVSSIVEGRSGGVWIGTFG